MPTYDYRCPNGHEFDDLRPMALRETAECECGEMARQVIVAAPRLDPKMGLDPGFPTAYANFRKAAEARGRGKDMTRANKTAGEQVQREAHAQRAARGENPITVS